MPKQQLFCMSSILLARPPTSKHQKMSFIINGLNYSRLHRNANILQNSINLYIHSISAVYILIFSFECGASQYLIDSSNIVHYSFLFPSRFLRHFNISTSLSVILFIIIQTHNINYRIAASQIQIITMSHSESTETIIISVSDPEVKKQYGGAKQYYLYSVKGQDAKGSIDIHRRYSDFDLIRSLLIKRWPGCYIPSLPSKIKLMQSDEQFLQTRSKYLQKFLVQVSKKRFLWDSDEMQLFLRNNVMEFDKVLSGLWKVEPQELVYRYQKLFKDLSTEDETKLAEGIDSFSKYLSVLLVKLQQLRNKSQELHDTQAKYQRKYSKFLIHVLSSYETKFLSYYHEEENKQTIGIFSAEQHGQRKQELMQTLKEAPLKILFEELKREKRQILGFQQIIRERGDYVKEKFRLQGKIKEHEIKIAELKNGKKSFLEKVMSVSTETEIKNHEKSVEKYRKEQEVHESLCRYISLIIGTVEIKGYKEERVKSYYKMVKQIAREEINIIEKERLFWMGVAQSPHLNFDIEDEKAGPLLQAKGQSGQNAEVEKDISKGHYEIEEPQIRGSRVNCVAIKPVLRPSKDDDRQNTESKQPQKQVKKRKSSEKQNTQSRSEAQKDSKTGDEGNKTNRKTEKIANQVACQKIEDTKVLREASKEEQAPIQRTVNISSIVKMDVPDSDEPEQIDNQQYASPRQQDPKSKPLPQFFADHT